MYSVPEGNHCLFCYRAIQTATRKSRCGWFKECYFKDFNRILQLILLLIEEKIVFARIVGPYILDTFVYVAFVLYFI